MWSLAVAGGILGLRLGTRDRLLLLSEPLDLQLLRDCEKLVEVILGDVGFPEVHEVQDGGEVGELDTLEVDEGMLVRIPPENLFEEG